MSAERSYSQEADYNSFLEQLPDLLKEHEGKVVVIHNCNLVDFYDTMEQAVEAGNQKFGVERFIAQDVIREDPEITSYSLAV